MERNGRTVFEVLNVLTDKEETKKKEEEKERKRERKGFYIAWSCDNNGFVTTTNARKTKNEEKTKTIRFMHVSAMRKNERMTPFFFPKQVSL